MMYLFIDIDHTLAASDWRDPLWAAGKYNEYFSASAGDEAIPEMVQLVRALSKADWICVAVTARPREYRLITTQWMVRKGIPIDMILMNEHDPKYDIKPAPTIKIELIQKYIIEYKITIDNTLLIVDDRDDVAMAFRALGYTVLQCHYGRRNPAPEEISDA